MDADQLGMTKFLESDSNFLNESDIKTIGVIQSLLKNPSNDNYLFIDSNNIFKYDVTSDQQNDRSTESIHFSLQNILSENKNEVHKFTIDVNSVSQCLVNILAVAKEKLLLQIFTEPIKRKYEITTLLLLLLNNADTDGNLAVQEIPHLLEIEKAYGSVQGDIMIYHEVLRPSVLHLLEFDNCNGSFKQKVLPVINMKEYFSQLCISPAAQRAEILIGILSPEKCKSEGRLITYDLNNMTTVAECHDLIVSNGILKFNTDGSLVVTFSNRQCVFYVLQTKSLELIYKFEKGDYVSVLDLPFHMPSNVKVLDDKQVLRSLPVSTVVHTRNGLFGLSLKANYVYLLLPLLSVNNDMFYLVNINCENPVENSIVEKVQI